MVQKAAPDNPHLRSRLEKAAFLVLLRSVEVVGSEQYGVGSEDGLRCYDVVNGHCECSDYVRQGAGHPCKHRLALTLYLTPEGPRTSLLSRRLVLDGVSL